MIDVQDFRDLVIRPTLAYMGERFNSEAAVELLLGTAIQESQLTFLKQIGGGPALGVYQMEPATAADIWDNYVAYRQDLVQILTGLRSPNNGGQYELIGNLPYATAMSRIHYWRVSEPLPAAGDLQGQADYWKEYYNTIEGAGTVEEYIEHYNYAVHTK